MDKHWGALGALALLEGDVDASEVVSSRAEVGCAMFQPPTKAGVPCLTGLKSLRACQYYDF